MSEVDAHLPNPHVEQLATTLGVTSEAVRRATDTFALFKNLCRFEMPVTTELVADVDGCKVRITGEDPPRILLIDLLCAVTDKGPTNITRAYKGVLESPVIANYVHSYKIPGARQCPVKVVTFDVAKQILELLPKKKFRDTRQDGWLYIAAHAAFPNLLGRAKYRAKMSIKNKNKNKNNAPHKNLSGNGS